MQLGTAMSTDTYDIYTTTSVILPRRREEEEATYGEERGGATAAKSVMGRPSIEALAMAGADWTQYCVDDDDSDDEDAPPEHLRAFEAFLETVVPPDMVLAFGREEAARARRGERRRSHREDVEEKLKLWAKAVARETTKRGVLRS